MNPEITTSPTVVDSDMQCVPLAAESSQPHNSSQGETPALAGDRLDWDAHIPIAPKRRSGSIRVELEYGGRGKPTPVEDPWA
jgi:hypothetical protein